MTKPEIERNDSLLRSSFEKYLEHHLLKRIIEVLLAIEINY